MADAGTALVTGGTGLLGRRVVKEFASRGWKVVGTGLTRAEPPSTIKLDLVSSEEVERVLDEVKPDVVVHCAANRFPDSCSDDPAAARALNVAAPSSLAALTRRRNIFLLYISTDYVFPGAPGEAPYTPTAPPAPPNIYGLTKWEGERGVLEAAGVAANRSTSVADGDGKDASINGDRPLAAVLRVPILYGSCTWPAESAVNALVPLVQKAAALDPAEPRIRMDDYAQRYPTNTADVARVCFDICTLYAAPPAASAPLLPAILHFSSEDRMTKFDMCRALAGILALPTDGLEPWKPAEEELRAEETVNGAVVRRPFDCHLHTGETRALGIDCSTVGFENWWRKELRAFRH